MAVKLSYGLRDGKIVHISEIDEDTNGKRCNCICPACKGELEAKLGKGRHAPHFSHVNSECDPLHAQQTGLHLLAKEIIAQNNRIALPAWDISRREVIPKNAHSDISSKVVIELPSWPSREYNYQSVELEKPIGKIIADAEIMLQGHPCIVEIAVTHFVDECKTQKVTVLDRAMFEIDLSDLIEKDATREEITKAVLYKSENRKWIYNPKREVALFTKKKEFRDLYEKYATIEEEKQKRKEEYNKKNIIALQQLFLPENYGKEVRRLRDDSQSAYIFKRFSFSNILAEYPFYMNIPITGEFVFQCDRRIWQGELFDVYVYKRFGQEVCIFSISKIHKRISNRKMMVRYDKRKVYRTTVNISGQDKEISLSFDVIRRYFEYLEFLGFTSHANYEWYSTGPATLKPPNQMNSAILRDAIRTTDPFSPAVNQRIKEELLMKLPEGEKNIIFEWDKE